jgi:type II secretory pathway component GspD/PulD (secretin)
VRQPPTEYIADNAEANLLLGALAKKAGLQFIPNPDLDNLTISARIRVSEPRQTIDDIATHYGWLAYDNGSSLFVRTAEQMSALPTRAIAYPLRYLRQNDVEALLTPLLTPGSGQVRLESKTNTVLIRDNDFALRNIEAYLKKIDRAKASVNIQSTIFRIVDSDNPRYGIDWSQTLGAAGYPISFGVQQSLDMLFNFASPPGTFFNAPSAAILRPGAITFVTRALTETLNIESLSNPNLILEDNEEGTVSLVDRFPIITFQPATNQGSGTNFISLASEVRYRIDETDPVPTDENPGRQLGTSLRVRATIMEDGLIRLSVTPRSADISEFINVPTGENTPDNRVPRVAELSSTTTVSIAPGSTVLIGGFTNQESREEDRKVPVLGDIPLLGTLFKDRETRLVKTRVVFAVTPTLFNPANESQVVRVNNETTTINPEQQSVEYGGTIPRPLADKRGMLPKKN